MYHIRTVGMCTSKAAIKMCTSRGGRVNVNPKYTQTHTYAAGSTARAGGYSGG